MTKFLIYTRQKFAEFLFYILCIFLIILMFGCSDESFYTNQIPTATITSPEDGATYNEGDIVIFDGSGADTEDKNLSGDSLVWNSSVDKQVGTGVTFTINSLSAGSHTITLTVFDSDGASGSASVSITVSGSTPGNANPTASITSPSNNSTYNEGDSITFEGSGTDAEDGNLTGSSLVWTSSADGQIGTGISFSKSNLSTGAHTITLTATDSNDETERESIEITIN